MRPRTIIIVAIVAVLVIGGVVVAEVQRVRKTSELLDDLDTDEPDVAVDTLKELKDRGHRIEDVLIEKTNSPRRKARMRAAILLAEVGTEKSGPALVGLLEDEWLPVRRAAVVALGRIMYAPAVTNLLAIVQDEEAEMDTRCLAVQSLGWLCMGALDETDKRLIVPTLVDILERRPEVPPKVEEEEEEAEEEAEAEPEEPEEEPIPAEPAPVDTELELRKEAVLTLGLTGVDEALDPLVDSISDKIEPAALVRQHACMAVEDLAEVPSDQDAAMKMGQSLLRALKDDDASVRMFAARALARHPDFGDALDALDQMINAQLSEMAVELTDEGEAAYWVREAARIACDRRHVSYEETEEAEERPSPLEGTTS